MTSGNRALLEISDLTVHFALQEGLLRKKGAVVQAVNGVSLALARGEVFGLVGSPAAARPRWERLWWASHRFSRGRSA